MRVLFVCTGNICRSPMVAAFARALLPGRAEPVSVCSAGLLQAGWASPKEAISAMRRHGLDLSSHRSSLLAVELAAPPDLVVAMAREHARAVLEHSPNLFSRTFTLKEIVRRAETRGPRHPQEALDDYLDRVGEGRSLSVGMNGADDVADPLGRPATEYERCAAEIERLVRRLVELVWPTGTGREGFRRPRDTDLRPNAPRPLRPT